VIILDFIRVFVVEYAPLLFSAIALVISLKAARTSENARLFAKNTWEHDLALKAHGKRSEILNEIDLQHALFGTLLSIFYQKMLLFHQYPLLLQKYPDENKRLNQNVSAIDALKSRYDIHRSYSEKIDGQSDLAYLESVLAEIRRLTIHIQEDIKKEQSAFDMMVKQCRAET